MATSTANITAGVDLSADASITRDDLENAIVNAVVGDFTRGHVGSSATIPTIGTSAPTAPPTLQTGEVWVDTADPVDGAGTTTKVHTVKSFNGTAFRPPVSWSVSATAPTHTPGSGMGWWDRTNFIKRIYDTANSVTGWLPIDGGAYQIMTNRSGITVSANRIVIFDSTDTHSFTTTAVAKHAAVFGVTLESIDPGANGLVALVTGGEVVNVYCNVTDGDITAGDAICQSGTLGEGRNASPLNVSTAGSMVGPRTAAASVVNGVPHGAFAVALENRSGSAGLVKCKMLGTVGTGAIYEMQRLTAATFAGDLANANWDGTVREIDLSPVFQGLVGVTTKYDPFLAARMGIEFTCSSATLDTQCEFRLLISGSNASTSTMAVVQSDMQQVVSRTAKGCGYDLWVRTHGGTPWTTGGSRMSWVGVKGTGQSVSAATLYMTGVLY